MWKSRRRCSICTDGLWECSDSPSALRMGANREAGQHAAQSDAGERRKP
jgi:hypothetical protein